MSPIRNIGSILYSMAIAAALAGMHATAARATTETDRLALALGAGPTAKTPEVVRSYGANPHKPRIAVTSFSPSRQRGLTGAARRRGKVSRKRGH